MASTNNNTNTRDRESSQSNRNWNIRGLNSDDKQRAVRSKIDESGCAIYCIQETKMQNIEHSTIRKWAPRRFNQFAYQPSQGQSRGIIIGWSGRACSQGKQSITSNMQL